MDALSEYAAANTAAAAADDDDNDADVVDATWTTFTTATTQ